MPPKRRKRASHQLLIAVLQTGVEGKADRIAGVGLRFREITLPETKPAVIGLQMHRGVVQLHPDTGNP